MICEENSKYAKAGLYLNDYAYFKSQVIQNRNYSKIRHSEKKKKNSSMYICDSMLLAYCSWKIIKNMVQTFLTTNLNVSYETASTMPFIIQIVFKTLINQIFSSKGHFFFLLDRKGQQFI